MINHNLDFDIDESNLKVIYILDIGKDSDNKNIYHFLLSENCEDTFSEGWDEKPSCNIDPSILKPDESQYKDRIIALAYENLDEAEEYPEDGRIVIHFGDYIDDVESMLARRDMRMKFV